MKRGLLLLAILTLLFPALMAEGETGYLNLLDKGRKIESSWRLMIGSERAKDNYLSTVAFRGTELAVQGEWGKMLPNLTNVGMAFDVEITGASMLNVACTERMVDMGIGIGWRLYRRWINAGSWRIDFGGRTGVEGGMLYDTSNGNNPVSARAAADLSAALTVMKDLRIGKIRMALTDRLIIPVAGLFFSPQYGESYYEIYLGNHSGLIHFGYPGNRFIINNTFCVGFPVGKVMIEAGYALHYYSTSAGNLTTRICSNAFVAGVRF